MQYSWQSWQESQANRLRWAARTKFHSVFTVKYFIIFRFYASVDNLVPFLQHLLSLLFPFLCMADGRKILIFKGKSVIEYELYIYSLYTDLFHTKYADRKSDILSGA